MKNAHLIRRALAAPWAMHHAYLPMVLTNILQLAQEDPIDGEGDQEEPLAVDDLVEGRVAVLPLQGVLLQHPGIHGAFGPVTFTEWWGETFMQLMGDPEIAAVVIDADTPGGIVYGTQELADLIRSARGQKPILTSVNSLMASAGLWIGTAADDVFVTPSGDIGSHGVYSMHADFSKALEEMGVDVTFIHAGKYKVEGNPFEPLSDEAREEMQRSVDESYAAFTAGLVANLGVDEKKVLADFGQGRVLSAERAVEVGMAHGIATLEEVIAEAAKRAGVPVVPAVEGRSGANPSLETRAIPCALEAEGGEWPLVGAGMTYGRESADMGGWRELFQEGAFVNLEGGDQRVLWQHDSRYVLGRTKVGTAKVWSEGGELRYAARPPEAQWARDAMESIRRRDVDKSSIGFRVPKGGARWERRDGYDLRIVSRAELVELGPQTFAAYGDTSVAVRERAAWLERRGLMAAADANDELRRELEAMEAAL